MKLLVREVGFRVLMKKMVFVYRREAVLQVIGFAGFRFCEIVTPFADELKLLFIVKDMGPRVC
jgi:hypothetical protein